MVALRCQNILCVFPSQDTWFATYCKSKCQNQQGFDLYADKCAYLKDIVNNTPTLPFIQQVPSDVIFLKQVMIRK